MSTISRTKVSGYYIKPTESTEKTCYTTRTKVSGNYIKSTPCNFGSRTVYPTTSYASSSSYDTYGYRPSSSYRSSSYQQGVSTPFNVTGFCIAASLVVGVVALSILTTPSHPFSTSQTTCHYEEVCTPLWGAPSLSRCHQERVCETII